VLPLAAFGGRAAWTAWSVCAASVLLALVYRPRPGGALDRAIIGLSAAIAVQFLPLPAPLVDLLSPHARAVRDALAIAPAPDAVLRTLSVDTPGTCWAAAVWSGAAVLFWTSRSLFAAGGVRLVARLVGAIGFAVSLLAIAQAATAGRRIFWLFPTDVEGPLPFGPFVNRNHFATWVIMALPVTLGYLAAHAGAHAGRRPGRAHVRARLGHTMDPRAAWLALAAGLMLVALLLSLSRSGVLALGASAVVTLAAARRAMEGSQRRWMAVAVAALLAFGLLWSNVPALVDRVASARDGLAGRLTIWRETGPIVGDFPLTGTGAGTYQRAMFVYQRSDRAVYFNQAHNHYLQTVAEGGLLLAVPTGVAAAALLGLVRRRLAADTSGLRWVRLGAACGLGAVALQSLWETGLVMPANAVLAAVLAAMAVHERHTTGDRS
jgi:O-antigen ligase